MTSFSIHGIGVSNGIAIGKAHLISNALLEVVQYDIDIKNVLNEIKRFDNAIASVKVELNKIKSQLPSNSPGELGAFIDTHIMILSDKSLSAMPRAIIENERCNAEWAIKKQMDSVVNQFDQIEDEYPVSYTHLTLPTKRIV